MALDVGDPGVLGGFFSFLSQADENVEAREVAVSSHNCLCLLGVQEIQRADGIQELVQQTVSLLTNTREGTGL